MRFRPMFKRLLVPVCVFSFGVFIGGLRGGPVANAQDKHERLFTQPIEAAKHLVLLRAYPTEDQTRLWFSFKDTLGDADPRLIWTNVVVRNGDLLALGIGDDNIPASMEIVSSEAEDFDIQAFVEKWTQK